MQQRANAILTGVLAIVVSVAVGLIIGRYSPLSGGYGAVAGPAYALTFSAVAFPVSWKITQGRKMKSILITIVAAVIGAQFGAALEV